MFTSNHIKHDVLKFCKCKLCLKILISHILNMCDIKIKKIKNKLLGKKLHKSMWKDITIREKSYKIKRVKKTFITN